MVWAMVVVAIAVLGVAAWAGTGKLGEMPGAVTDRPKAHIPDAPVDETFLRELSLPVAGTGYRRSQVDALLAAHVAGQEQSTIEFDVVRHGYDMQAVDAVLDTMTRAVASDPGPVSPVSPDEDDQFLSAGASLVLEDAETPVMREAEHKTSSERLLDAAGPEDSDLVPGQEPLQDAPQRAADGDFPAG